MSINKMVGAIVILVAVFIIAAFLGYNNLKKKYEFMLTGERQITQNLNHDKELLQQNNQMLHDELEQLTGELEELQGFDLPLTKMEEAFDLNADEQEPLDRFNLPFRLNEIPAEKQVQAFFNYLDSRPYIADQVAGAKTYEIFLNNVAKLGAAYPNVAGETKTLFDMVKNIAYFFRTMGKRDVELTQAVLQNENDIVEPVMAAFYDWFTAENTTLEGRPDLKLLYEYSDYLLNSFGGRAYLARRSAKVRMLTVYYCLLTVDRANDRNQNYNGIDIRPYLNPLLDDMRTQMGLINRDEYIAQLKMLQTKYQRPGNSPAR